MSNLLNKSDLGDQKQGTITDLFKKLQEKQESKARKMIRQISKKSPQRRKLSQSTCTQDTPASDKFLDISNNRSSESQVTCDNLQIDLTNDTSVEDIVREMPDLEKKTEKQDINATQKAECDENLQICDSIHNQEETDPRFVCPICGNTEFKSLSTLNEHMDLCLFVTNEKSNINNNNNNSKMTENSESKASTSTSTSCSRSMQSSREPSVDDPETVLVCPVCNIQQQTNELLDFNKHVDACLNRGTIKEMLKQDSPTTNAGKKRCSFLVFNFMAS